GRRDYGFDGFHTSSVIGDSYRAHVPAALLKQELGDPDKEDVPPEIRDDPEEQYLNDWKDEECADLGLPPTEEMDRDPEKKRREKADSIGAEDFDGDEE